MDHSTKSSGVLDAISTTARFGMAWHDYVVTSRSYLAALLMHRSGRVLSLLARGFGWLSSSRR
jgi:hypothetical protein